MFTTRCSRLPCIFLLGRWNYSYVWHTKCFLYIRFRFTNISQISESWFTLGFAPTHRTIPESLPKEQKINMKLRLMQRFIFHLFKALSRSSYTGVTVASTTLCPRISFIFLHQQEDLTLLCLKGNDFFMDCRLCNLPSSIFSQPVDKQTHLRSSEDDADLQLYPQRRHNRPRCRWNSKVQRTITFHPHRNVYGTLGRNWLFQSTKLHLSSTLRIWRPLRAFWLPTVHIKYQLHWQHFVNSVPRLSSLQRRVLQQAPRRGPRRYSPVLRSV